MRDGLSPTWPRISSARWRTLLPGGSTGLVRRRSPSARSIERKGRSPSELAAECRETRDSAGALLPAFDDAAWAGPAPGGYDGTLGEAIEALWYDAYVHADDIRHAVGMPTEPGPGLGAATSHVLALLEKLGWNGEIPDGSGEAHQFVLAATGRAERPKSMPNIYA